MRVLAPLRRKAGLGMGRAIGVVQAFDVAAQHRFDAYAFDEAVEVHHHAGLVAVGAGQNHPRAVGIGLEDGPQGAVKLGVHQHHMLAVGDGSHRHMGCIFDGAGDLDDGIYAAGAAKRQRIFGHRRPPLGDRPFKRGRAVRMNHAGDAGLLVGLAGRLQMSVGDSGHPHAGHRQRHLQRDALGHEAGPDQADAYGFALLGALGQCVVNKDHALTSACVAPALSWAGQAASLAESWRIGTGQAMPKASSS